MSARLHPLTLTLTPGQQAAFDQIGEFLVDPTKNVFVLKGFAGTGKTTLVERVIKQIPYIEQSIKLIDSSFEGWELKLTATTNKAAEALAELTGQPTQTIHSFLGLRVQKDYKTGETTLVPRNYRDKKSGMVIVIDEGSYADRPLLKNVFALTENCKIIFVGDPAQLCQFNSKGTPVFESGFSMAELTEVVRQAAGNPIIQLATSFRHTVNTGEFFSFTPDNNHIKVMDRAAFADAVKQEFTRPDWTHQSSKVLAWTNRTVIAYNNAIRDMAQGSPEFQVDDYAVLNSYLPPMKGAYPLKTDELVKITYKSELSTQYDTPGWFMQLNQCQNVFLPQTLELRKSRIRLAKAEDDVFTLRQIDDTWADLRAAYSCTINKAQGSTYDKVFIDLDDIKGCNSPNQIARMLYVAVSRAREQVVFVGDLI